MVQVSSVLLLELSLSLRSQASTILLAAKVFDSQSFLKRFPCVLPLIACLFLHTMPQ